MEPYKIFLVFVLVVSGAISTLVIKWADLEKSLDSDGVVKKFQHPFFQTLCVFFAEMFCFVAFKLLFFYYKRKGDGSEDRVALVRGNREFSAFVLFFPALLDVISTSIMFFGLNLTYASSYQMLRGSAIVFAGILSVPFLHKKLVPREWTAIFLVIISLFIIGISNIVSIDSDIDYTKNDMITGDLLIIIAQILVAIQMVVQEKYVVGLDIPRLQAIGWEGIFGFSTLCLSLLPLYFISVGSPFAVNARGSLEDIYDAFIQMKTNNQIIGSIIGLMLSVTFFNCAGISYGSEMSATIRILIDSLRTIIVWMFTVWLKWHNFHYLQLIGFVLLFFGMCLYSNVIILHIYIVLRRFYIRRKYGDIPNEVIENRYAGDSSIA